jgi:L-2-hydroxyglutarate oxidase LhgO
MDHFDAIVIGAGVVGLAVARQLALQDLQVLVLEAAQGFGTETSSRNSEVIHAGALLSTEQSKGAPLLRGAARTLRLLRQARHSPSPMRKDPYSIEWVRIGFRRGSRSTGIR